MDLYGCKYSIVMLPEAVLEYIFNFLEVEDLNQVSISCSSFDSFVLRFFHHKCIQNNLLILHEFSQPLITIMQKNAKYLTEKETHDLGILQKYQELYNFTQVNRDFLSKKELSVILKLKHSLIIDVNKSLSGVWDATYEQCSKSNNFRLTIHSTYTNNKFEGFSEDDANSWGLGFAQIKGYWLVSRSTINFTKTYRGTANHSVKYTGVLKDTPDRLIVQGTYTVGGRPDKFIMIKMKQTNFDLLERKEINEPCGTTIDEFRSTINSIGFNNEFKGFQFADF